MNNKIKISKNKSIEYPVIYSYIYEREGEDIQRLADKFKTAKQRNINPIENKVIVGYTVKDGKATPIYSKESD